MFSYCDAFAVIVSDLTHVIVLLDACFCFSNVEIAVTSDGNTIVCYHPTEDVPYELTQVCMMLCECAEDDVVYKCVFLVAGGQDRRCQWSCRDARAGAQRPTR